MRGKDHGREDTFIVPTTEESSERFKLLLNQAVDLVGHVIPRQWRSVTKPNIHTSAHNHWTKYLRGLPTSERRSGRESTS